MMNYFNMEQISDFEIKSCEMKCSGIGYETKILLLERNSGNG